MTPVDRTQLHAAIVAVLTGIVLGAAGTTIAVRPDLTVVALLGVLLGVPAAAGLPVVARRIARGGRRWYRHRRARRRQRQAIAELRIGLDRVSP